MPFAPISNGSSKPSSKRWGFLDSQDSSGDPYSSENLDRQIANAQARIEDAGYNPQDGDGRNWFEKATNLTPGQNWLFDALELLGRPGNAVKNVVDKAISGDTEDYGTAFVRGLSGKEKVSGADLAQKMGITEGPAKFVTGLGLDIGLDPLSYVPAGVIEKAVAPVGKLAKSGYNALEEAAPALRNFRETQIMPRYEAAKDALGYMFNPDYKITQTLDGGENDFLKNLAQDTENNRRYLQQEYATNLANVAKDAGGIDTGVDVGRIMEAPLKQFEDVPVSDLKVGDTAIPTSADGVNLSEPKKIIDIQDKDGQKFFQFEGEKTYVPENMVRTEPREIPRPERELSTDPAINQAAQSLLRSNQEIRQLALDKGIDIPQLEGYMTHILSQEERKNRVKVAAVDRGQSNIGNPNKSILKSRTLMGSAEDVNDRLGRKFFEPNAYFATAIGQKRLIDYIHAVDFRRKVLTNTDFARPYVKGMEVPKDAVVIDSNKYTFLKDGEDSVEGAKVKDEIGGQYIVTKQAKMLLDRYQHLTTDEGIRGFLKAFDAITSFWKRFTLFSWGYHIRNQLGAMFNNAIAGMKPQELATYTLNGYKEVLQYVMGKESKLYREFRKQGLGASGLSQIEFAKAGQDPEDAIRKTIENMSKTGKQKAISKLLHPFQTSQEIGEIADQANRFALFKWAIDKGMTPKEAAAKVREVQYDYSKLTPAEREVFTRVIPFYRWMRKNIPYQIKAAINDPRYLEWANKARINAQSAVGLNDDNIPEYMKENYAVPVYGANGKGKFFSANLPFTDLTKLSNPLKTLTDSLTPVVKTPMELALNYNMFRGKPIEKFQGQQQQFQFGPLEFGLPAKTAYALQQATGQIGRGLSGYLQKPDQADQDNKYRVPSLGISSLTKDFDAEKAAYLQKLQQLKQLQDMINYIQQQTGTKPRTTAEIKKGQKAF